MAEVITLPIVKNEQPVNVEDLTTKQLAGNGVLDVLLQAMRIHLDDQYEKGRIRGPEYATVYLGAYTATMNSAIEFLLAKERQGLEFLQLQAQIKLIETQQMQIEDQMKKTPYEIELLQAQVAQTKKQTEQIAAEMIKIPIEIEILQKQSLQADRQLDLLERQIEVQQATVDLTKQKVVTEKAQTQNDIIQPGSYLGANVSLINAQKDGYKRDAEQKAAQLIINTWNTRRTTDEDTSANTTNLLDDSTVGRFVQKLAAGVEIIVTPS